MAQMINTILFDNDGTLSDSVPICREATNKALAAHGFPPVSLRQIADGMRLETPLRMMDHAGIDDRDLGRKLAEDYYAHVAPLVDETPLFPGVAEMLRRLVDRGCTLGVVSNNRSDVVVRVLKTNNIAELFSVVIGEDNAEETKPASGGLLQACRLLDANPEQTVYIGDGPSDAAAASAANMPSVGVLWNLHGGESVASMGFSSLVRTPGDLPDLLEDLSVAAL